MKFALAGNPNCGKTTLFNALTGSTAHVGNWPGVTVDKREGTYKKLAEKVTVVDLPGIYSLSPYTPEEVVSKNFILDEKPECVINVIDATNMERNLYLTTQVLEMDVPVVVALNMSDLLSVNGLSVDAAALEKVLGVPVVEISALKGTNIDQLMKVAYEAAKFPRTGTSVFADSKINGLIAKTQGLLAEQGEVSTLFHAVKIIEGDESETAKYASVAEAIKADKEQIDNKEFEGDFEALVANDRYVYISANYASCIAKTKTDTGDVAVKETKSDKIDKVLTHRIWGIPIFLIGMLVIFHFIFSSDFLFLNKIFGLTINNEGWANFFTGMGAEFDEVTGELIPLEGIPSIGVFLQSWMGWLTGSIIDLVGGWFEAAGAADTWYCGLVCDGVLTGLDSIFSFLPQIMCLFLVMAVLEDTGYMARVAFIMDRAFRKFGLSGKAFIPLLMGFGCSVPAMMSTKTLENEKERDMTIRLAPFFSCGAKAPIWAMLALCVAGSFFGDIFVFMIYLLGIVVAIVTALFVKLFTKNDDVPPFIMELPAYHAPQARNLGAHLWEKLKHFIYKASTIITAAIILIWFLSDFGWAFWKGMVDIEDSILADLGRGMQYFYWPLGFTQGAEGWKYAVSVVTGLIAKEDVIATMATLGIDETTIALNNAQIMSFAAYNLFTFPCFAAIGAAYGESSKKGFWITLATWFCLSYVVALVIYWIGWLMLNALVAGIIVDVLVIAAIVGLGFLVAHKRKAINAKAAA